MVVNSMRGFGLTALNAKKCHHFLSKTSACAAGWYSKEELQQLGLDHA